MTGRGSGGEQKIRFALVGMGMLSIGWGAWHLFQLSPSDLISAAAWFTAPAILSDLVLLPVVAVVGGVFTRRLEPWVRLPAQVALALVGVLLVIALPFLTGLGKKVDNPSLLDRNYPLGVAVYVLIIVVVAGVWALARRRSVGHRRESTSRDTGPVQETTW